MNGTIETRTNGKPVAKPSKYFAQGPIGRAPAPDPSVLTTRTGLQIPPGMKFEDWEQAGQRLAGILDSSSWWLGDWLVYGKDNYADRYQKGIRAAGLKYQTLRNYAWVSRRFDQSRRRAKLTFQHHAEVASLPLGDQDVWLERAENHSWTTKQLRSAIQGARNGLSPTARQLPMRKLPVPENRLLWWHKAAETSGVDFDKWVLMALDKAAEQALTDLTNGALTDGTDDYFAAEDETEGQT